MYRATEEEIQADQREYKKSYPPFEPFTVSDTIRNAIADRFSLFITTQNGMDTDDYCVADNNKTERFLSGMSTGSRVLILGTGTGREVVVAKDMGLKAVGTTLGSRNVYFGTHYLGLGEDELLECINEALPFGSASFDMVAGFQVFEHTIAPLIFLLEQRRVLKPGGKLLLEWPPADKFHMDSNPHHQVCYTPGQAEALMKKAGFRNIKLYYDDLTPIAPEDFWRGDQDKMLVVEGIKSAATLSYAVR